MSTMENKPDNTFLSDWMAGRISDEQLKQTVSEIDYLAYVKLRDSLGGLQIPDPDMDRNYAAIKAKRIAKNEEQPTKVFSIFKFVSVAAAIAILFGLYELFIFSNTIATDFRKTAVVALNDHSKVTLNAKSQVAFPTLFKYNRTIQLEGEAFFEVTKGRTFTVETAQGEVEVLGTKFNVIARPDFFEVFCMEGKVKVCANNKTEILVYGDAVRFYKDKLEKWEDKEQRKPLWISGESAFRNVPLEFAIDQFQNQYHHVVEYPKAFRQVRFSGSFTHTNLNTALQSICIPMNLKYTQTKSGKIIISE
jgi:transmembrane sensor